MRVLVLHDAVTPGAPPEALDTLHQATAVRHALERTGHQVESFAVASNLNGLTATLGQRNFDLVFNLVESLAGVDGAAVVVPAILDGLGICYTGSNAAAQALANDKPQAKRMMRRLQLPTPDWFPSTERFTAGRYLIKARFEHGSFGLDDGAIADYSQAGALRAAIALQATRLGRPCFAERFISGREFNLSLLQVDGQVRVLRPAEIDFSGLPAGRPHIVGYRAKWVPDSPESRGTPRCFPDLSTALAEQLVALSTAAFETFGLKGYARVDMRLSEDEAPWILEVNPNPCIAPDAGFVAALEHSGYSFQQALEHILRGARCSA